MSVRHHVSRITFIVALAALLLATCAPASTEPQPPDIAYGQDMCDACGMIISEARFASALLLTNGEVRKFDDTGDMFAYHMDHPDQQVRAWFVHDYRTEEWVRGEKAFYVVSPAVKSPMGRSIAAFATQEAAKDFAAGVGAQVFNFEEARLQAHVMVHGG